MRTFHSLGNRYKPSSIIRSLPNCADVIGESLMLNTWSSTSILVVIDEREPDEVGSVKSICLGISDISTVLIRDIDHEREDERDKIGFKD